MSGRYFILGFVVFGYLQLTGRALAAEVTGSTEVTASTEARGESQPNNYADPTHFSGSTSVTAASEDDRPVLAGSVTPRDYQMHGFISQGYFKSTANNFLSTSKTGSFDFSEAGLNFTVPLTEKLTAGLQLFAQGLGPSNTFTVKADWFQLDYRWKDWFGIRAGRIKLPFGLYNDVNDVDAARVPILLPQSIYPLQNRNFLLAQSGGEVYGYVDLGSGGGLDYRVYGGTIVLEVAPSPRLPFEIEDLSVPYILGGRLLWETPLDGLRVGGSLQALRLDTTLFYPAVTSDVDVRIPAILWVGSAEYTLGDFQATAEYSRWHVRVDSSNLLLFPETPSVSERMYGMASYRFTDWFQVGSYFSRLVPDISVHTGRASKQNDFAGTLRFDINPFWLVKLEGHLMSGTAALDPRLNGDVPRGALEENWGLFLLKTTAYF